MLNILISVMHACIAISKRHLLTLVQHIALLASAQRADARIIIA